MRLFCLDSSGPLLSLACVEEDRVLALWEGELAGRRSEQLMPKARSMFEKLQWEPSSLDWVAVSRGPGSFTGLRVGLAFAKGLALDGVKVLSESTLEVWAQSLAPQLKALACEELAILLDARRGQVYRGHYLRQGDHWKLLNPPILCDVGEAKAGLEKAVLGGDLQTAPWEVPWLGRQRPLAQGLAELVLRRIQKNKSISEEAALLHPDYLRRPEVEILWEKRQGEKKA